MIRIQLRTGWKACAAWVLGLAAVLAGSARSIAGLYDTQAAIDDYARSLGDGGALAAINGRVAGVDTLGGVIANELGFLAFFALPLMGISMMSRWTRRDEASGRLELLLAGRISRASPVVAAATITTAALALVSLAVFAGLVSAGVPATGSMAYAASLGSLGFVFAGIAAASAQVVAHPRGTWAVGLGVLAVAYLVRGVGAVLDNGLTWLSPLGWAQQMRAFGETRWWPVLIPLALGLTLIGAAVATSGARDLGSALVRTRAASPTASRSLLRPVGLAVALHRGSIIGWAVGAVLVSATFGALAQQVIEALADNDALQQAFGASGGAGIDVFLAMSVLLLALICCVYAVQAVATMRAEETAGRLEPVLAGRIGRGGWLANQLAVILSGLLVVGSLGAVALGLAVAAATGEATEFPRLAGAVLSYLPAVLALAAAALVLFAVRPRAFPLAWFALAFVAVEALLGEALQFPDRLAGISPLHHVGNPPQDPAGAAGLVALLVLALVLSGAAFLGFRRRSIPEG